MNVTVYTLWGGMSVSVHIGYTLGSEGLAIYTPEGGAQRCVNC